MATTKVTTNIVDVWRAALRLSVPLVVVRTEDQQSTIAKLSAVKLKGKTQAEARPLIQWDASAGLHPLGQNGATALNQAGIKAGDHTAFNDAMFYIQELPTLSIVFALNAQRQLQSLEPLQTAQSVQGVSNLRNQFKLDHRMLVMLVPYGWSVPVELGPDVVTVDDPLPDADALRALVLRLHEAIGLPKPSAKVLEQAVDALAGLTEFSAEQQTALSFTENGLDVDALWERKRQVIESDGVLKVWRGGERFDDIVGNDGVKTKLRNRLKAKTPIGVVVWVDEIDKVFHNVEADTTGVRQYQQRTFLTEMEDNEWPGLVAVGVSGGGKSLLAKAFGNEAGVPTIALDLGATEGSLVGESEAKLRKVMAIIKAVGRGHAYFIATSNNQSVMRPEVQRRFRDGMFFFDIMTDADRAAAWKYFIKKYDLPKQELPDDSGWTGAEIRNAALDAWDMNITLKEAAKFIMPMNTARADDIDKLRRFAHNRFLDAAKPGFYQYAPKVTERQRAMMLPEPVLAAVAATVGGDKKSMN